MRLSRPTRRTALGLAMLPLAASLAGRPAFAEGEIAAADWRSYAQRFVTPEGRVVDTGNGGISHSESMGYGLILAAAARDRAAFDRMWAWTRTNLMTRPDGLAAWRWEPGRGVTDTNNATDGDLLIAFGLLKGAEVWRDAALRAAALALAKAIRETLAVEFAGQTLLLPGAKGFRRGDRVILNPSYFVFPALQALAAADRAPVWEALGQGGLVLLAKARFGRFQLPPDWVELAADGSVSLPSDFKAQFGYDAIRVPLYLAWGGYRDPYYFRPYAVFAAAQGGTALPATVALPGGTTGQVAASAGMMAVHRLAVELAALGGSLPAPAGAGDDYYAATLYLLAGLAERTVGLSR
jgi:endoglucanase